MPFVTTKVLKTKTGLSLPTIRAALKAAEIIADATGKIDEAAALIALAEQVDPARTAGHAAGGFGEVAESTDAKTRGSLNTYADARAISEQMRARKLELEILHRSGELVEREQVKQIGVSIITSAKINLLALPSKLAPKLLGLSDAAVAQRIVEDAITEVLNALADDLNAEALALS
jgi:hypothetical protein